MDSDNPILNNPYDETQRHYATDDDGALDYSRIVTGRRVFTPDIQVMPVRQGPQQTIFELNDRAVEYDSQLVNLIRKEVGCWRKAQYPNTTRITKDLLGFWFLNPDRHAEQQLFFAQREAIETAVWLNEVAARSNAGQYVLNRLSQGQVVSAENPAANLPRLAFKMATGTGKTVVMATQILYHFFNRQEYRNDTRFADFFLVVAPGITIKNRLGVLFVDLERRTEVQDYYHARFLIPHAWEGRLGNLNARIVVTNYHAFEPRTVQGNKRSPFDGKLDPQGRKKDDLPKKGQRRKKSDAKKEGKELDGEEPPKLPPLVKAALENSNQITDDFKKVFASEIEAFRREYARVHGQGSVENITEVEILREVVNTVGKKGTLGSHIRCVVSVSMLTEGWDANTVTHIMGLRAFGSQLLCEQVAGRALRRKKYYLQSYDEDGNVIPEASRKRYRAENIAWKFPPEYAHIIGVPFKMFRGGTTQPPPPRDTWHVRALPERQEAYEITFPNVVGYRVETHDGAIEADFSGIESFEIDGSKFPLETTMTTAFGPREEMLSVRSIKDRREQELFFAITKELISLHYSDDEGHPYFQKFNQLRRVVEEWYRTKVALLSISDPEYKKLLFFFNPKAFCDHISRGIQAASRATDRILPVLNFYNRLGSTAYVTGHTSRHVYPTKRSHVNYVVADTDSWEQVAAKTLEELPDAVEAYVKNAFLGFAIPYVANGKDQQYFPDFIARCRTRSGRAVNLIVEITGMNKDKAAKKWYVENRWLPAVNCVREKYGFDEWAFIEIADDIRDIKNQLAAKIHGL